MAQVQARKDRVVSGLTKGVEFLFKKNKIDWIKGTARLTGNGGVDVFEGDTQTLRARKEIIVATGSAPRSVPGIEIDRKRIITSDEAIGLREVPKSIAILGSGAVGVEFASIFRRFGSDVTILELLPRLVPVEDEAVSAELEKSFRKQGITAHTGARVTSAHGERRRRRHRRAARRRQHADDSRRLSARGHRPRPGHRRPRRGARRAASSRRATSRSTRSTGRTCPGISAIGDVITLGAGAASAAGARVVGRGHRRGGADCRARDVRPLNYDHVPGCTYCDPEIGSVGLTEREAQERGYDVRVGTFPFGVLGRAKMAGETEGFVKIVAEKKYDEVLGVHMIGPRSTELVAEATVALRLESTVEELIRTIHAHPDHGRGRRRGGACRARRGDSLVTMGI